jgi:hypothetical protein
MRPLSVATGVGPAGIRCAAVEDPPVDDGTSSVGSSWDPADEGQQSPLAVTRNEATRTRRIRGVVVTVILVVALVATMGVCVLGVLAGVGAWLYSRSG